MFVGIPFAAPKSLSIHHVQFLTILAFNVFCLEKVDVAIVEVGIGGEYDTTNIIRRPRVCAITSLGVDHTRKEKAVHQWNCLIL
jgi:folylpolyglutamate synthase/dihydropteroate synthase